MLTRARVSCNLQLPSVDEVQPEGGKGQNKRRIAQAKKKRMARLRYQRDVYCKKVLGVATPSASPPLPEQSAMATSQSFVFSDHSFDSAILPALAPGTSGDSPLSLATTMEEVNTVIERLPDAEARSLAQLSANDPTDDLENRLTMQHKRLGHIVESLDGSISSLASSIDGMGIDQMMPVLDEMGAMGATASHLATSHFSGVTTTVTCPSRRLP